MKTAECVSKGHPDKICDQVADAILDDVLSQDPESRVAIEVMGGHGVVTITGEMTTTAFSYMDQIAKKVYREIGYTDEIGIQVNVVSQSPDIAKGVDIGGAGDQGIMVGYACDENESLIPQEIFLARKLITSLPQGFGPDAKSQVTLKDNGDVDTVVISAQHQKGQDFDPLYKLAQTLNPERIFINPTGEFTIGGFSADTGVTGRKLAVDNYGPQIPIGGGAFSGKDPSKVDRSAAYMARKIAVDLLKEYDLQEALVKIAYSIGVVEPIMVTVEAKDKKGRSIEVKTKEYDLTPQGIIKFLDLKKPIYRQTAGLGHFGHNFKWDR